MGTRGPIPKRQAEQMGHRTKAEKSAVETVAASGQVAIPSADPNWHDIAVDWFDSLKASGQAQFFEPSDWAAARYVAEVMTKNLNAGKFSAQLFASVWTAMSELLTTEGARRRVRVEVHRQSEPEIPEGVAAIDAYRSRLSG
jgi:hypothetical protein